MSLVFQIGAIGLVVFAFGVGLVLVWIGLQIARVAGALEKITAAIPPRRV